MIHQNIKRYEFEKNLEFFDPLNLKADIVPSKLHNPDTVSQEIIEQAL